MSETKHTPGPWAADIEGANTNSVSILGPDPRLEVAVIINDSEDLTDTDLANARLIAAAPDLLRALEEDALPYLDTGTQALVDEVARIKAAIRKAKGL